MNIKKKIKEIVLEFFFSLNKNKISNMNFELKKISRKKLFSRLKII